jgi:hypothetical protein
MDILLDAEIVLAWHITNLALTCMHVRLQQHTGCLWFAGWGWHNNK